MGTEEVWPMGLLWFGWSEVVGATGSLPELQRRGRLVVAGFSGDGWWSAVKRAGGEGACG